MDIDNEATSISFGVLLDGTGKIWIDDMTWEEVPKSVPTTDGNRNKIKQELPLNMEFEK